MLARTYQKKESAQAQTGGTAAPKSARNHFALEFEAETASATQGPSWSFADLPAAAQSGNGASLFGNGSYSESPGARTASSRPLFLQAKLEVGAANDPLEHEADRVAEQVMRMPDASAAAVSLEQPGVLRKCSCGGTCAKCRSHDAEEESKKIQRSVSPATAAHGPEPQYAPPSVEAALRAPGEPLEAGAREFFERRFGYDFSQVRIHSDTQAAESARAVGAHAFTVGTDIVFQNGRYAPGDRRGRQLLAHELTHVVQQKGAAQHSISNAASLGRSDGSGLSAHAESHGRMVQRDLATAPPATVRNQPDLTAAQIRDAIAFNQAHYDRANTRLIQNLLGGPVTGTWTEENIESIAATQGEYGLTKDGKVGNETFRFLDREQHSEGMSTKTEDCLVSFAVIGPDQVNSGRDDATHCHFGAHHRIEAQFSPRCNCADFQYRQFIAGHWRRTRGGVVTDLPIAEVAGVLGEAFVEDADVNDPVPNYGHRNLPAGGNVEDHYVNASGADDQANGCRYRAEDFPGFNPLGDCLAGDQYDLVTRFRGEIQRGGRPIQTKSWTEINLTNWHP